MSDSPHNKEIEVKLRLSSFADYLKLLGHLGNVDGEQELHNCFFDTEDRMLADSGWALRVRVHDKGGLVTVKGLSTSEGVATVRQEIEDEISRGAAQEVINLQRDVMDLPVTPIEFLRKTLQPMSLARLVEFRTNRKHKYHKMGDHTYCLQVDQTSYGDGSVDYEIEVEISEISQADTVEDCLRKLFDRLDIPFVQESESKLARALARSGLKY